MNMCLSLTLQEFIFAKKFNCKSYIHLLKLTIILKIQHHTLTLP